MNINHRSNQFKKSGIEFKEVLQIKTNELQLKSEKRKVILEKVRSDTRKLRSYLLKINQGNQGRFGVPGLN